MSKSKSETPATSKLKDRINKRSASSQISDLKFDPYIAKRVEELERIMKPFCRKNCLSTVVTRTEDEYDYVIRFEDRETMTTANLWFEFAGPKIEDITDYHRDEVSKSDVRAEATWEQCHIASLGRFETMVKEIGDTGWIYLEDESRFNSHDPEVDLMSDVCDSLAIEDIDEYIKYWLRDTAIIPLSDKTDVKGKKTENEVLFDSYHELKQIVGRGSKVSISRDGNGTECLEFIDASELNCRIKFTDLHQIFEVDGQEINRFAAHSSGGLDSYLASNVEARINKTKSDENLDDALRP